MTKRNDQYPNKADYEPNVDKNMKEDANLKELPLADPAESNATKAFRENETTTGENKQSAFGVNKDAKDN